MKLSEEDIELFYKLHPALLLYVGKQKGIVSNVSTPDEFKQLPPEKIDNIRKALYKQTDVIDSFVRENPHNFSKEELEIILGWKNFVKGSFCLLQQLKNHAIFLDSDSPPKAYGVLGLYSMFEEMVPSIPIMIKAVLLPFRGKIVYDGFLHSYNIILGGGIRRSFNDAYQEAKSRFGIITSLPFSAEEKESSEADVDRLKFYLGTKRRREEYCEEIEELIGKNPELLALYHQEMGKIHARKCRKDLRRIGLSGVWFAALDNTIIASGTSKEDLEQTLQKILPDEKRKLAYVFRLK